MMAKDPNQRYQSMSEVIAAIERGRGNAGMSWSGLAVIFGFLAVFVVCLLLGLAAAAVYFLLMK
jgi:hypothetical protein